MGLLGRLFGGSDKKEPKNIDQRSKRGRAPSIRKAPGPFPPAKDEAPLPEINLDDLDQQQAGTRKPAVDENLDPIPVDFEAAPAPPADANAAAAAAPPAPAPPSAPRKDTTDRRVATPSSPRATRRSTRLQSRQKPLGEILIQAEAVNTEQLSRALKIQDKGGKGLVGQILVNMGACQPTQVAQALGRQFRISTIELERVEVAANVAAIIPEDTCRQHRLVPFEKLGKVLCLAMANCLNRKAINEIEQSTNLKVKPFNCSWVEIRDTIDSVYSQDAVREAAAAQAAAGGADTQESATAQAEAIAQEIATEGNIEMPPDLGGPATSDTEVPDTSSAVSEDEIDVSDVAPAEEDSAEEELRPFSGPARAVIEGLDDLDTGDAEEVRTTQRGLASRHLEAIQARREQRAKSMGKGETRDTGSKLIAPDLDRFFEDTPEVIDLRQVQESELAGAELPVAEELASSVSEFAEQTAPEPEPEPEPEAATVATTETPSASEAPAGETATLEAESGATVPAPVEAPAFEAEDEEHGEPAEAKAQAEELELVAAHNGEAEHKDEPQVATVAAAGAVAEELPAVPSISHQRPEPKEMEARPLSDEEWAELEPDLEPDPVIEWERTYASAGPVFARRSPI